MPRLCWCHRSAHVAAQVLALNQLPPARAWEAYVCLSRFMSKGSWAEEGSDPMSSFFLKSLQHSNFCPFNPDEGIHDCRGQKSIFFPVF